MIRKKKEVIYSLLGKQKWVWIKKREGIIFSWKEHLVVEIVLLNKKRINIFWWMVRGKHGHGL